MTDSHRLEYLDALRGFAMLLVVTGHVITFTFSSESQNFIAAFFCGTLQLPLFFMISGYFVWRANELPSNKAIIDRTTSKIPKLVISALLFMSLFCVTHGRSIITSVMGTSKVGYWYTISLFEFILIYQTIQLIFNALRLCYNARKVTLLCIFVAYCLVYPYLDKWAYINCGDAYGFFGLYHLQFFRYFLFGVLLRAYSDTVTAILSKGWCVTYIIALFLLFVVFQNLNVSWLNVSIVAYLFGLMFALLAVMITYMAFRKVKPFGQSKVVGCPLQIIGKHSLSVYFLHYFFLYMDLSVVGRFFDAHTAPLIEFVLALSVALLIVGACLIVNRAFCLSPFVSKYLMS